MSPSKLRIWIQAARPWTLGVAISPILMGTAIAHTESGIHWLAAVAALLGGTFIQIGTNLANDYFDFRKGADTSTRVGPQRVTQAGLIDPRMVRDAFLLCFGIAFLIGIYLVYLRGMPIVYIGLISLLLGVIYTGGPFPLAYNGLAELPAFLFFGPIACATTNYVQTGVWSDIAIVAGTAAGFFSMALLSINNLRDYEEDRKVGKNTLVAIFGRDFGFLEYTLSILAATLTPLALIFLAPDHAIIGITSLTVFMTILPIKKAKYFSEPVELIPVLKMTSKLQAIFTVIFITSWLV